MLSLCHLHTSKPRMRQYFFGAWPTFWIDLEHETKELEKLRNIGLRGSLFRMLVYFFSSVVFKSKLPVPIGDLLRDSWARKSVNASILREWKPQYSCCEGSLGTPSSFSKMVVFRRRASPSFPGNCHSLAPSGRLISAVPGQAHKSSHADQRQRFGTER